ncbi:MAG: leucine-rich repeat protein [Lachnospirales bacterium]
MLVKKIVGLTVFLLCGLMTNYTLYGNELLNTDYGYVNLENSHINKDITEFESTNNSIMLLSDDINSDFDIKNIYSRNNNVKALLFKYNGINYPDNMSVSINGNDFKIKSQPDEKGYVYEYFDDNEVVLSGSALEINFNLADNSTDIISKNTVEIVEANEGEWETSEDGHTLYTYNGSLTDIVVPNFYNGNIITTVGGNAVNGEYENIIYGNSNLTGINSVVISEGILNIGHFAFYDINTLTTAKLTDTIEQIGAASFAYTSLSDDVIIPENTKDIYTYAFRNSNIKSVKFNNILERIGTQAFFNCSNLTCELDFPNTLNYIGDAAFYGCIKITGSITIPGGVERVGECAFYHCKSLNGSVIFEEGVSEIGDFAFSSDSGYMTNINKIVFPNSLKKIGCFAFQYATKVTEFNLVEGLEVISDGAFNHMTGINNTEIIIPSTVSIIGGDYGVEENTGYGCHVFYDLGKNTNFTEFKVAYGNNYFTALDGVLYSKDMTRMVAYPRGKTDTVFEIPEGITQIDEMAFSRAAYLKKLVLPDSYIISIDVPENVLNQSGNSLSVAIYCYTAINEIALKDTNSNYVTVDGILYSKDMKSLWYVPCQYEGSVNIIDGTENMEKGCIFFGKGNVKWENVNIPKSVIFLNEYPMAYLNEYFAGNVIINESIYYKINSDDNKIVEIPFTYGDVDMNEIIDKKDASFVLKYVSDINYDSIFNRKAADYNNDGLIDLKDVVKIILG